MIVIPSVYKAFHPEVYLTDSFRSFTLDSSMDTFLGGSYKKFSYILYPSFPRPPGFFVYS